MVMAWVGDAMRMAATTARTVSEQPRSSVVAIRSIIQKNFPILPISPRGDSMCM